MIKVKKAILFDCCKYAHLGDLISCQQSAYQYALAHPEYECFLGSSIAIGKAKIEPSITLRQLFDLVDVKPLKYLKEIPPEREKIVLPPHWTWTWEGGEFLWKMPEMKIPRLYKKASNLPTNKKQHVTIQVNSRSIPSMNLGKEEIAIVMETLKGHQIINLGDNLLEGCINKPDASLKDKLEDIATAIAHFSVNSGMAHLARLTNTKTVILHRRWLEFHRKIVYADDTDQLNVMIDLNEAMRILTTHLHQALRIL
jgi:hypothetical protein